MSPPATPWTELTGIQTAWTGGFPSSSSGTEDAFASASLGTMIPAAGFSQFSAPDPTAYTELSIAATAATELTTPSTTWTELTF